MCFYRIFRRSCVLWGPFAFPFFMEDFLKLICLWKKFWESFAWRSFQRYLVFECRLDILPLYSIFPRSSVHDESLKGPAFLKVILKILCPLNVLCLRRTLWWFLVHIEGYFSISAEPFEVPVVCVEPLKCICLQTAFWSSFVYRGLFELLLFIESILKIICCHKTLSSLSFEDRLMVFSSY